MKDKLKRLMELNGVNKLKNHVVTNAELEDALMELAQGQSDIEEAIMELAEIIGGDM